MSQDFAKFFAPGRVHRQIYTDPAIFELEIERLFGAAWIYVGHESQVKNPGDYFATMIGRSISSKNTRIVPALKLRSKRTWCHTSNPQLTPSVVFSAKFLRGALFTMKTL